MNMIDPSGYAAKNAVSGKKENGEDKTIAEGLEEMGLEDGDKVLVTLKDGSKIVVTVKDGKLIDKNVTQNRITNLEHGKMGTPKAITLHQTNTSSAKATMKAWGSRKEGTHFLIGEDGKIYQTANLKYKTWHVGRLQSRCKNENSCAKEALSAIQAIENKHGKKWGARNRGISEHEKKKGFSGRYPLNSESIGIEVVGKAVNGVYPAPSQNQLDSISYLVERLRGFYGISSENIFHHGQTGTRPPSECAQCGY